VVESEAATLLMMRVAATCDRQVLDQREAALRRILIPVAKFWVTKRASGVVNEALECLGGNGYVEESVMPRLLRESPVNAIWEGSGNVIALDVMRAVNREPHALEAFMDEIGLAGDRRVTAAGRRAQLAFADLRNPEEEARRLVELLALAVQASLLVRFGRPEVAEAFAASRLEGDWGRTYGTLPPGLPFDDIRRGAFLPSD
jgi:putative acyl-CoA dehydrogenase